MGRLILICAYSRNGQKFTKARVQVVNEDNIAVSTPRKNRTTGMAQVVEKVQDRTTVYRTYEKAIQIEAQRNPSSTDLVVKQQIAVGLVGAGTTQGAGTAITKYFNETLTIGAGATEAFVLPAATVGKVLYVINNDAAGDAAKIFPAVGEFINAQAVNTVLSLAAGDRVCFVCPTTAGKWITADDFTK